MNARAMRLGVSTALTLALSACAGAPQKIEDPHHYSKDRHGNRIACYTTDTANEYECVPVARRSPAYDPYWDPYGSFGFAYGWPHYYPYPYTVYYPYPVHRHRHVRSSRR